MYEEKKVHLKLAVKGVTLTLVTLGSDTMYLISWIHYEIFQRFRLSCEIVPVGQIKRLNQDLKSDLKCFPPWNSNLQLLPAELK